MTEVRHYIIKPSMFACRSKKYTGTKGSRDRLRVDCPKCLEIIEHLKAEEKERALTSRIDMRKPLTRDEKGYFKNL